MVQEALEENNTRLNPFGRSAAFYHVGALVGRTEELPVKVALGGQTFMEYRGTPMKDVPKEPFKSSSASSSSGGPTFRKAPPPVPPGYLPGNPPAKGGAKGSMPSPQERPVSFLIKAAPPIFWDCYAKMLLGIMDDARLIKFLVEECAEFGMSRFNIEDQLAAIAVQQGKSTLGSWISGHEWVASVVFIEIGSVD